MTIQFDCSREDSLLITEISKRAQRLDLRYSLLDADMDLTACHCNGTPLKLVELLAADDANFAHDVFGIRRHLDRTTGKLTDCFAPRYAL